MTDDEILDRAWYAMVELAKEAGFSAKIAQQIADVEELRAEEVFRRNRRSQHDRA